MSAPSRGRRRRRSSDKNMSFVESVTTKMSAMLPTTITKWFSSPNKNTDGTTDSSTEDEAFETPAPKRRRMVSPIKFAMQETRSIGTNTILTEPVDGRYIPINQSVERNSFRNERHFPSSSRQLPINDPRDDNLESNFYKLRTPLSSARQSIAKKRTRSTGTNTETISENIYNKNVQSGIFKSHAQVGPVRRSIIGKRTTSTGTNTEYVDNTYSTVNEAVENTSRPFNTTSIGTNTESIDDGYKALQQSVLWPRSQSVAPRRDLFSSPMDAVSKLRSYSDSTFYSGRTRYGGASSSYINQPTVTQKTMTLLEGINQNSALISNSTRCVMELLSNYTTGERSPNVSSDPTPTPSISYSYKKQELHVSNMASILTIQKRSRLLNTTMAARQILASQSSTSEFPSVSHKSNTECDTPKEIPEDKAKAALSETNHEEKIMDVPRSSLQIDKGNLPHYSHTVTKLPAISAPENLKPTTENDMCTTIETNENITLTPAQGDNNPKFSSPITISGEHPATFSTNHTFAFVVPKNIIDVVQDKGVNDIKPETDSNSKIHNQKDTDMKSSDSLDKSDVNDRVCSDGKTSSKIELNSQGAMNADCVKETNNVDKSFVPKEAKVPKWTCSDCWVQNEDTVHKCVCCGGEKPKSVEKKDNVVWRCNDCWIQNKDTSEKCAACCAPKPGKKISLPEKEGLINTFTAAKKEPEKGFENIAKSQLEKWECPICLVRNENTSSKCVCCEADKPGTVKESQKVFNFHQSTDIKFKFGIPPGIQNTNNETNIETEESNMQEVSETNNNVLPTFKFGLRSKEMEELPQQEPMHSEKINFTFGVPKKNIFANSNNSSDVISKDIEEKAQEVPQIFTFSNVEKPKQLADHVFKIPVLVHDLQESPATPPNAIKSTTSSDVKTNNSSYTFSADKPASNLFPIITTTVSVPQSTPTTFTKTTTVSLFQTSDSLSTPAMSLFSKPESATSASLAPSTPQSVFSFGSNTSVPEKSKFQFSFGNNKVDSSSLFKPSFGVSNDTNKFNVPSNPATSGNVISGNHNTTQASTENSLTMINSLSNAPAMNLFGAPVQKDPMWFSSSTTTNTIQKPGAFTFGASNPTTFNSNSSTFGAPEKPFNNLFSNPTTSYQGGFGGQMNNQFPTFGVPSIPAPIPTPTFNFGSQQPAGIFGFGQSPNNQALQPTEVQPQQPGMYNFGASGGAPQQLQFNMGSAPNTGKRTIRKALRRTQR